MDLLLCGHHYRASLAELLAAGAAVYDEDSVVIPPADENLMPAGKRRSTAGSPAAGPARYAQIATSGWSAASAASTKGPGWPRLTCAGGPAGGSCPRCP